MKTRIPGSLHNSEMLQGIQVRQHTLRFRGSVTVYVASVAAPSAWSSESETHSFEQSPSWQRVRPNSQPHSVYGPLGSAVPPVVSGVTASSEHAAELERAASSGLATTSSFVEPSPVQRKRFSNSINRAFSTATASGSDAKLAGSKGSARVFRQNRDFQPREFTSQIANASSIAELQQLFDLGRKHDMNAIHIATFWTRLAKLASASSTAAARTSGGGSCPPQSSSPVAASQTLEHAGLVSFVGLLEGATTAEQLADMAPRGLANLVWAAAKLKPDPMTSGRSSEQDLLQSPISMVAGGMHSEQATGISLAQEDMQSEDAEAPSSAPGSEMEVIRESAPRPRPLRIRGGKTALAAAATAAAEALASANTRTSSTVVSEHLLDAWANAAGNKISEFSMQDISNVVWALGRLGYQPHGMFMTRLSIALLKELPRADRPQQISNVLLGLALLRFTPPIKDFWVPVWDAVQRLVLAERKEKPDVQGVTNTLWALSHLVIECPSSMSPVPDTVVSKAVFRSVQYADHLSGQQCQDVFVSLPRLGFKPSEYQASKLLALARRLLPSCDAQALSNILVSLVQLRVQPWYTWKTAALEAFEKQLPNSSPEAAARFLFAWAHMRMPPPVWAPQIWEKLHREVHTLTATDIAFVVLGTNQQFERLPRRAKDTINDATAAASDIPPDAVDSLSSGTAAAGEAAGPTDVLLPRRRRGLKSRKVPEEQRVKARVPPRRFLLALRDRWEAVGPEAQLKVVFAYRALVQEFFDSLDTQ